MSTYVYALRSLIVTVNVLIIIMMTIIIIIIIIIIIATPLGHNFRGVTFTVILVVCRDFPLSQ